MTERVRDPQVFPLAGLMSSPGMPGVSVCRPVTGIAFDSRQVQEGNVFVAIRGARHDGHEFVAEAVARGASAVVVGRDINPHVDNSVPVFRTADARVALARLACHFYGHPSRAMVVIGITGTNGKTTTAFMIDAILTGAGHRTGLLSTIYNRTGARTYPARLTTPEAPEIQAAFSEMRDSGVRFATMEVTSQSVQMRRIEGIDFDIGVFTNLSLDHLDTHGCFSAYAAAKAGFLASLPRTSVCVLNGDDVLVRGIAEKVVARKVFFGIDAGPGAPADVAVRGVQMTRGGTSFRIAVRESLPSLDGHVVRPTEFRVDLPLLGWHNVYNAVSAATVALVCGVPESVVSEVLRGFTPVTRRLELRHCEGICLLDDTALNPASIDAVFRAIRDLPYGKLVVVMAVRGNRGAEINRANGESLADWLLALGIPGVYTTVSASHVGDNDVVSPEEERAFVEAVSRKGVVIHHFRELPDAVAAAVETAEPGDVVVLLGAQGMDAGADIAVDILTRTAKPRTAFAAAEPINDPRLRPATPSLDLPYATRETDARAQTKPPGAG